MRKEWFSKISVYSEKWIRPRHCVLGQAGQTYLSVIQFLTCELKLLKVQMALVLQGQHLAKDDPGANSVRNMFFYCPQAKLVLLHFKEL